MENARLNQKFDDYFLAIYQSRWHELKMALLRDEEKVYRDCFKGFAQYYMDFASIRAANALKPQPGDQVLDMCAAPGGKALILTEMLQGQGSLVANELSRDRKMRMIKVFDEHVPLELRNRCF